MKFQRLHFFVVLFAFSFISCEEEKVDADDCQRELLLCTEEFKTILLEIVDSEGNPVVLDDFYTFYDSRKKFEYEYNEAQAIEGIYPVITDAEIDELEREGTTLIFVGVKNGDNLVEHQMVIGHDCCHIQLIEGEANIVISE
ncbi:hypothetical protein [Marivirga sp.]|uniref:hypothetical protein n=1 Tax=Marivirga sp. TaxID=2018662 RepID=UPI002D7F1DB3|nr:hypothetical protein [Marivirga sp.]HET8860374.1 hypothetical protein [Marivirga sp.]